MTTFYVPTRGAGDWQALLAEPEKQWKTGYSARALAHCWEDAHGFPPEIAAALAQAGPGPLAGLEPLLAIPEHKVPLPPASGAPSQNDVWCLARSPAGLVSLAIEGKVAEPFGETVREWGPDSSPGRRERWDFLLRTLGLENGVPASTRYQLYHRTASALLEARRFQAGAAVMLVHSFHPEHRWYEDFLAFTELFGARPGLGRLARLGAPGGTELFAGWVVGNADYLAR